MLLNHRSTTWKIDRQWRAGQIPPSVSPWVFDRGSLTQRLVDRIGSEFRVQRLRECWAYPSLDEALDLSINPKRYCWVREVMLLKRDQPLVVARSVIPRGSLKGSNQHLRHLGDRPLGGYLFADPDLERGELETAHLSSSHPLYKMAIQTSGANAPSLWGRRSVFWLNGKPLLVAEIFLPPCTAL